MAEELGLPGSLSIALGGMIGGGIFAVLGVVAGITGSLTWLAFVLAGLVALGAGYSYNALNALVDASGGSVTFVRCFVGNTTLAGMVGWTLLVGYIGSMGMYAVAFSEFALGFSALPSSLGGVPLRPVLSVGVVALFVGLNLLGARASGTAENALVGGKIAVLVALGVGGIVFATAVEPRPLDYGLDRLPAFGPIMSAAVSFVAFQGWQLLFYDQESIENPTETIRKAVYIAIPSAVAIYVVVAVVTTNLASEALRTHPHTALASAAEPLLGYFGYASVGFTIVSLAALLSTGSALNATLFSSGHLAKGMVSQNLLPDRISDGEADGVPPTTLVVLGAITAALTVPGSLGAVTSFASLAFIVVFGSVSYLAFRHREEATINPLPPLVGMVGAVSFLPLLFWHLYHNEPETFVTVLAIAVVVALAEVLYFEHDALKEEVVAFERDVEAAVENIGHDREEP
ncbi:amino acid permease [Natronomonas halophila]|uniref:APC family permease n=1 Tax=Natronomonas halophila TaxID=2747817 RepID=UPI0015B4626F|nr:APC family permease [Natronomonas halophila]QLD86435.1 amino acid permease [Natronomonas halophila]